MNDFENQKFCQSCAMPLAEEELFGTNADGTKNDLPLLLKQEVADTIIDSI